MKFLSDGWPLFKSMTFLDPTVKERYSRKSNLDDDFNNDSETTQGEGSQDDEVLHSPSHHGVETEDDVSPVNKEMVEHILDRSISDTESQEKEAEESAALSKRVEETLKDLEAIVAKSNKKQSSVPLQSTPVSSKAGYVASGNFSSSGDSYGYKSKAQERSKQLKDETKEKISTDKKILGIFEKIADSMPVKKKKNDDKNVGLTAIQKELMEFGKSYGKRVADEVGVKDHAAFRFQMESLLFNKIESYKDTE